MHNQRSCHAFVNGALSLNIVQCYKISKTNERECDAKYTPVSSVDMKNLMLPTVPELMTDITSICRWFIVKRQLIWIYKVNFCICFELFRCFMIQNFLYIL